MAIKRNLKVYMHLSFALVMGIHHFGAEKGGKKESESEIEEKGKRSFKNKPKNIRLSLSKCHIV